MVEYNSPQQRNLPKHWMGLWAELNEWPFPTDTAKKEAEAVALKLGMNATQAQYGLRMIRSMRSGELFTVGLNIPAARYFLEQFELEGSASLKLAVRSLDLHTQYVIRSGHQPAYKLKALVAEFQERAENPDEAANLRRKLDNDTALARELSSAERLKQIPTEPQLPKRVAVTTYAYVRNPNVVAEVLEAARGVCQSCKNPAPFRNADGEPYLEVHHKIPLSRGGYDTVANAIAICPNCHRAAHYAREADLPEFARLSAAE